ncbi:uncharacterized protein [Parasteatoda tepidariorum]|uniref:uncharacterized protein n=1 Tax=Parasteatoda tepidariorum TaxID=114398 RepID=UPI00077FBB2D|nr:uncharacterized protein LOC107452472 [Parasteatoda tepidariorum]
MISPSNYLILYDKVQSKEVEKYDVKEREIKFAIKSMVEVYKPDPRLWGEKVVQVANYDDPAYRCAYLYKYAPLHTCLVQDMFTRALNESVAVINPDFWSNNDCINICSLGGGPGIDAIGVLSALHRKYGLLRCHAQIIESMPGWKDTFKTILEEFQNDHYGLSGNLTPEYFQFSYIVADLLGKMDSVVNKAIGSANLITMVKFLSAATSIDTAQMIRKIFNSMRHGAVVFIIDNASGGYSELVSWIAEECRMIPVFGPLQYVQYKNAKFCERKYGSRSCFSTQVTVHLLMKPCALPEVEWNFPLKPAMNYKRKNDFCSLSEDDSAVPFRTFGYNSDFSKIVPKSFTPFYQSQDKLNVTPNVDCDSRNPKSFAIHQRQDKFNFAQDIDLDSSNFKSSVNHRRQYKLNVEYNIDYDSSNPKSFASFYQRQDKLNVTYNLDCDSSFVIHQTQDKFNLAQDTDFDSNNLNSSVNHKKQDKLKAACNIDYDSSNSKSFAIHQRQDKLNVAYIDDNSSNKIYSMAPGSNILHSNKFDFANDWNTTSSLCHPKCYDNLETKAYSKNSNGEPALDQTYCLTGKSNSTLTERNEIDSRFNYPLYELFPQNYEEDSKDFKKLLSVSIDGSKVENNKKHVAPIPHINLEKMLFREGTKTNEITGNGNSSVVKATPHNTEENATVERECNNCSKLKRIKWLKKMCKFCNT